MYRLATSLGDIEGSNGQPADLRGGRTHVGITGRPTRGESSGLPVPLRRRGLTVEQLAVRWLRAGDAGMRWPRSAVPGAREHSSRTSLGLDELPVVAVVGAQDGVWVIELSGEPLPAGAGWAKRSSTRAWQTADADRAVPCTTLGRKPLRCGPHSCAECGLAGAGHHSSCLDYAIASVNLVGGRTKARCWRRSRRDTTALRGGAGDAIIDGEASVEASSRRGRHRSARRRATRPLSRSVIRRPRAPALCRARRQPAQRESVGGDDPNERGLGHRTAPSELEGHDDPGWLMDRLPIEDAEPPIEPGSRNNPTVELPAPSRRKGR